MSTTICRDCGYSLSEDLRGCPQCALNLEFERKMDRVVWRVVVPLFVLFLIAAIAIVYLIR
jgi:hypothetical protein